MLCFNRKDWIGNHAYCHAARVAEYSFPRLKTLSHYASPLTLPLLLGSSSQSKSRTISLTAVPCILIGCSNPSGNGNVYQRWESSFLKKKKWDAFRSAFLNQSTRSPPCSKKKVWTTYQEHRSFERVPSHLWCQRQYSQCDLCPTYAVIAPARGKNDMFHTFCLIFYHTNIQGTYSKYTFKTFTPTQIDTYGAIYSALVKSTLFGHPYGSLHWPDQICLDHILCRHIYCAVHCKDQCNQIYGIIHDAM